MKAEIKKQLEKFMNSETGYYNTRLIRESEGTSSFNSRFLDIFGDDEDMPETKSEMLIAAEEFNTQRMETERKAEMDANTADAVLFDIVEKKGSGLRENEIVRRTSAMYESERQTLVRLMLQRIDFWQLIYDEKGALPSPDKDIVSVAINRFFSALTAMRLGREYGDIADQAGGVDISAAYAYINE